MKLTIRIGAVAALAAVAVAAPLAFSSAQSDPIKTRKDFYQTYRTAMGQIKAVVDANGPAKDAEAPATVIASSATKIPTYFPAGSDQGDTKAKPNIWQNMADFQAKADGLAKAAQAAVEAAKSGDIAKVKAAFGALGGACKACHDEYRAS